MQDGDRFRRNVYRGKNQLLLCSSKEPIIVGSVLNGI